MIYLLYYATLVRGSFILNVVEAFKSREGEQYEDEGRKEGERGEDEKANEILKVFFPSCVVLVLLFC